MSVSTTTTTNSYSGNGSTVAFFYTFEILADADIKVILVNNSTGVESVKTLTADYSVIGAGLTAGNA